MTTSNVVQLRPPDLPALQLAYLREPLMQFGEGGLHVDPKAGIARYGPHSLGSPHHPTRVRVGLVGSAELSETARSWLGHGVQGIRGDATNPTFPGFSEDRGFFSALAYDDAWNAQLTQSEMESILSIRSQRERFERVVELFEAKVALVADRDHPPDYLVLVISEELLRRSGVADYMEPGQGRVHRDLRRAIKSFAMKYRIPTQLIRQRTVEGKDPTAPSKVAWNFFTGLYHKAGGFPWIPTGIEPGTCFVGVSFFRPLDSDRRLQTSLVQAFDEYGQGLIMRGHEFEWDSNKEGSASPHLSEEDSARLTEMVLDRYEREVGRVPVRIVVQKTSRFWPAERAGFAAAISDRVSRYDLLALTSNSGLRLMPTNIYPPLRGTRVRVGELDLLYTTGFIASLNEFHGMHVPSPIQIADHVGQDTSRQRLLEEILILTKLNWNSAAFCGKFPVTLRFARLVGEILKEVPADREPLPQFKFYI